MLAKKRTFRIEKPDPAETPAGERTRPNLAGRLDRVTQEISELRFLVERLSERDLDSDRRANMKAMWEGVDSIRHAIDNTRSEITKLHAKSLKGQKLNRATDELDAVVSDTESATETILASAEAIDSATAALKKVQLDDFAKPIVDEIHEQAIRIFEACNFQDISGQRISKVVGLLRFVESAVANMAEIWSRIDGFNIVDALEDEPVEDERVGDEALLNGPSLKGDDGVVSQDDIDSLFN